LIYPNTFTNFKSAFQITSQDRFDETYSTMQKILKILTGFTCVTSIILLSLFPSCDDPYDYYNPPGDLPDPIYTQIKKESNFSIFASGIEMVPELQNIIDASGLYTAFIPTDSAFQEYFNEKGINSLADLSAEELQTLINYHLVFDLRFAYDFWYEQAFDQNNSFNQGETRYLTRCDPADYIVRDIRGRDLIVRAENKYINIYVKELLERTAKAGGNYVNDYKLVYGRDPVELNINASMMVSDSSLFDLNAENGALHGIREVIEPPERIDEIIASGNNTKLFKQIIDKLTILNPSGLVNSSGDSLYNITFGSKQTETAPIASEDNLFTVFLPPDKILAEFLGVMEEGFGGTFDNIPNTTLTELFLSHISEGSHWDKDISEGVKTLADPDKTLDLKKMITRTRLASNGMVYYVDEVLIPDKLSSVTGPLLLNQDLLTFSKALERAGSLPNLSNLEDEENLKTVLAIPTEAFADAGIIYEPTRNRFKRNNKTMTSKELKHLFEYHVIRGEYSAEEIEDGYYETENYMWVLAINGEFFGNEAGNILKITETFDWGMNGYVHVIDKVLVPPEKSLKNLLTTTEEYSSFATALAEHHLLDQFDILVSDGTYHTLFIPPNEEIDKLVADTNFTVEEILMYHIVETYDKPLFTIGTENGAFETFLEDAEIEVELDGTNMTINEDATVVGTANVLGISGVIQQVDKVLYPPIPEE